MYDQPFSRSHPGCIVVLLDRSDSMKEPWGTSGLTLAQAAACAVNKFLLRLCLRSVQQVGAPVRDYFSIGVYGYGACPIAGGEGVESALGGALTGRDIVPLSELCNNPLAVREEASIDAVSPVTSRAPVWIEPVHGYRTPTCQAIATVGAPIFEWANLHRHSFPPIVINITNGMTTDSPFKGADLATWAKRLTGIQTEDGATLLFNTFLSPGSDEPKIFPSTPQGLPVPGPELFETTSPLPQSMIDDARDWGLAVGTGARGLAFQADLEMLVRLLDIGSGRLRLKDRSE